MLVARCPAGNEHADILAPDRFPVVTRVVYRFSCRFQYLPRRRVEVEGGLVAEFEICSIKRLDMRQHGSPLRSAGTQHGPELVFVLGPGEMTTDSDHGKG